MRRKDQYLRDRYLIFKVVLKLACRPWYVNVYDTLAIAEFHDKTITATDIPTFIQVTQRDNVNVRDDTFQPVFRNGLSNQPWHYNSLLRWFTGHLRRAKVRHRGPNQCRHTFASQMLPNYVSMEWVARQLGHTDTTMVKKHHGRWIKTNTPNMAKQVSAMLGYKEDMSGQENAISAPILPQASKKP